MRQPRVPATMLGPGSIQAAAVTHLRAHAAMRAHWMPTLTQKHSDSTRAAVARRVPAVAWQSPLGAALAPCSHLSAPSAPCAPAPRSCPCPSPRLARRASPRASRPGCLRARSAAGATPAARRRPAGSRSCAPRRCPAHSPPTPATKPRARAPYPPLPTAPPPPQEHPPPHRQRAERALWRMPGVTIKPHARHPSQKA